MHKLTSVESERILAVLDEAVSRLQILKCVPESPVPGLASALKSDGKVMEADKLQQLWMSEKNSSSIAPRLTREMIAMIARDSQVRFDRKTLAPSSLFSRSSTYVSVFALTR